jgi:two-component system, LytTR family, sensor kinase
VNFRPGLIEASTLEYGYRFAKRFLIILGIWTLIGLLSHLISLLNYSDDYADPAVFWVLLQWNVAQFYTWGFVTPLIVFLLYRFPIERGHIFRSIVIYAPLYGIIHFLWVIIYVSICYSILDVPWNPKPPYLQGLQATFISSFKLNAAVYAAILISLQALIVYRNYQTERLKSAELQTSLAKSQLQVLNTQLNPHFLFNTLTAVSALVYRNPSEAVECLAELSDLLRVSLSGSHKQETTLRSELDFLHKYVQIQQTLLQSRLKVKWMVSPETLDAEIPNMILQPLVENSIRHGIAPRKNGGTLEIGALLENKKLHLYVKDDGVGFSSDSQSNKGFGLKNTRERLELLYGDEHLLEIRESTNGGAIVDLIIPFKESEVNDYDDDPNSDSR